MKINIDKHWIEKEYWVNQKSLRDIGEELNISYQTIRRRMNEAGILLRERQWALRLKRIKNFDKTRVKNISYILGVLLGDGFVSKNKNKRIIGLNIAEKDFKFAGSFYNAFKNIGLNPLVGITKLKDKNPLWSNQIRICVSSISFYEWYRLLNMNKIEEFIAQNLECMKEFVRGFYESEGTIFVNNKKNQRSGKTYLGLRMVNTKRNVMELVNKTISRLGFNFYEHETTKNGKPYYYSGIWKHEEIVRFLNEINPVIKRKPRERGV